MSDPALRLLVGRAARVSSRGMRLGPALLAGVLANAACSDGVGVPIREALESDDGGAGAGARDAGPAIAELTCEDVADWPPDIAASEDELLRTLNEYRTDFYDCGERRYEPRDELLFASQLRCSARLHSLDLAINRERVRGIFGSDGSDPLTRMVAAGFEPGDVGELIADNEDSVRDALADLFRHENNFNPCVTFANRAYTHIGVGRYEDYWTVDFAEEATQDATASP